MKIKNFQNNPKVYYLIGALKDGCLTKQWAIKFSQKDKTWFSSTIIPIFNDVFGTNYNTEKRIYKEDKKGKTWCLIICNKKLWIELKSISKTTPKTKEEQKYYVRGFWDADGGCPKNPTFDKKIYIKFTQKDKNALIQIKNILKDFNIKSGNVRISETTSAIDQE